MILKEYFQLIKPGIICGNLISVTGGFLLASKGKVDALLLFSTLLGVSLVVASGCAINNYIDRDIDAKMERTKNRVLVRYSDTPTPVLSYATILGASGLILLYIGTNLIATWLAVMGLLVYAGIYSLYMKRHSVYGTLIGSLSGATPPVIGYSAVTNNLDSGALILLAIFSLWQMPHSYAIAIFRFKDYQIAKIPVFPIEKGIPTAKHHIIIYILAFMIAALMLNLKDHAGYKYLLVSGVVNLLWLGMALRGYKIKNNRIWARQLFIFSIVVIVTISIMMSVDFTSATLSV